MGPARGALWGKVAVVTGGGSGVGRAVAKAMAKQGANIVVSDFDEPRMDRTVEEILRLGTSDSAITLAADVRSDSSVRRASFSRASWNASPPRTGAGCSRPTSWVRFGPAWLFFRI